MRNMLAVYRDTRRLNPVKKGALEIDQIDSGTNI